MKNLDEYSSYLSKKDSEKLFKYCLRNKDLHCIKKLYSWNKSLLSLVEDSELKQQLLSIPISSRKLRSAKCQSPSVIISTLQRLESSLMFIDIQQDGRYKHTVEFIPVVTQTLYQVSSNMQATAEKKATKDAEKITTKVDYVYDFLPPSYLGYGYCDIYVKQNIASYRCISAQVAQQTVISAHEAYTGFFESAKLGAKSARPPNYIKGSYYNLSFQTQSFKVIGDCVRLSLGKSAKEDPSLDHRQFIYFNVHRKLLTGKKVNEVEVVPSRYNRANLYKLVIKYNKETKEPLHESLNNVEQKASIDLGIVNLATLYSPSFKSPLVFSGTKIVSINKDCNRKIDAIKSNIKKCWNKLTCKAIQDTLMYRENAIKDCFDKITSCIMNVCTSSKVTELIVGYNANWKCKVNMGKSNNRTFYEVPYKKFINMLFYKGQDNGVRVVENEEAYTSKCDALGLEAVQYHDDYSGRRIKRGLFSSVRNVLINADVNGAINIMRKYIKKAYPSLVVTLNTVIQSTPLSHLCNPIKLKIDKKRVLKATQELQGSWPSQEAMFQI